MKQLLLFIFAVITCNSTMSQNITLNELIQLRTKDPVDLEEFLSKKQWVFIGSTSPDYDSDKLGIIDFAFEKNSFSDKAKAFLSYYYSDVSDTKRVNLQFHNKNKYLEYLESVKKFNPSLHDSTISGNSITKVYRGKTTTFEFGIARNSSSYDNVVEIYTLFITNNDDYDRNY